MDRIMRRIAMHMTDHSWYDSAQEFYNFTKGEAVSTAEKIQA